MTYHAGITSGLIKAIDGNCLGAVIENSAQLNIAIDFNQKNQLI